MADVIRVVDGDRWTYVPADGTEQARLERFASADMVNVANGTVFLKSDAGPLFWHMLGQPEPEKFSAKAAAEMLEKNSIRLMPDENITFGKKDGAAYNGSGDISLEQREMSGPGLKVAARPLEDGEIVMTAWPEDKTFIPARATVRGKRVWLELAEPQDDGQRCFVLDEKCRSLITVSHKTDGSTEVQAMVPAALDSWLCSVGSKAVMGLSDRYTLEVEGTNFTIKDLKTGRKYKGQFTEKEGIHLDFEKMRMERLLGAKGIGAIIPSYVLKRA